MANKKGNRAAKGVAGAMIGAAVVAGAAILRDKKTRKKIEGVISDVRDQAVDYIEKQNAEPKVSKKVKKTKQAVKSKQIKKKTSKT